MTDQPDNPYAPPVMIFDQELRARCVRDFGVWTCFAMIFVTQTLLGASAAIVVGRDFHSAPGFMLGMFLFTALLSVLFAFAAAQSLNRLEGYVVGCLMTCTLWAVFLLSLSQIAWWNNGISVVSPPDLKVFGVMTAINAIFVQMALWKTSR